MLPEEEETMQGMEGTIDCQEQLEQGRFLDVGSNYMALAGISHEEMWEEAGSLGFVAIFRDRRCNRGVRRLFKD